MDSARPLSQIERNERMGCRHTVLYNNLSIIVVMNTSAFYLGRSLMCVAELHVDKQQRVAIYILIYLHVSAVHPWKWCQVLLPSEQLQDKNVPICKIKLYVRGVLFSLCDHCWVQLRLRSASGTSCNIVSLQRVDGHWFWTVTRFFSSSVSAVSSLCSCLRRAFT